MGLGRQILNLQTWVSITVNATRLPTTSSPHDFGLCGRKSGRRERSSRSQVWKTARPGAPCCDFIFLVDQLPNKFAAEHSGHSSKSCAKHA